jgi:hypothetical protein
VLSHELVIHGMKRSAATIYLALSSTMLAGWCAGCDAPKIKPVLTDPDPSVKIPAIALAVKQHDCSAIPVLVQNLESDDPAIRFYSNDGLRKLTGLDFGYLYYADEETRRPAVEKWRNWLASPAGKTLIASRQP